MLLVLFILVTTSLYYLAARAEITQWLWSRYPPWLDRLARCPACAGFWLGLIVGVVAAYADQRFLGLPWQRVPLVGVWSSVPLIGLCSMFWTAIGFAWLQSALVETAIDADEEEARREYND
jgi:hypothetical protein